MFIVKAGTAVKLIRPGLAWTGDNVFDHVTRQDAIFDKHEVVADPVRSAGRGSLWRDARAEDWAAAGWYGFTSEENGFTLLVPVGAVSYKGAPTPNETSGWLQGSAAAVPTATCQRPDVGETNGLVDGAAYHAARTAQGPLRHVAWTTAGLRVTRLRLLSDPGFPEWSVSYCHGQIGSEDVEVDLPFDSLPKGRLKAAIIEEARRDRVYARQLGILDAISTLN